MKNFWAGLLVLCFVSTLPASAQALDRFDQAELAADYLATAVLDGGRFVYRYDPVADETLSGYNILRHAGSVYALIQVYERTEDAELLVAIERALAYLAEQARPCPDDRSARCIVEAEEIKLGGNGLALLAFASYEINTGDARYHDLARDLANWIVGTQVGGEFSKHLIDSETGRVSPFTSLYYPGEAMYGLVKFYTLTGGSEYLEAAQAGARQLIEQRSDTFFSELPHDHWFMYALNELHRVDPQPVWIHELRRLTWAIVLVQHTGRDSVPREYLGGWGTPPRVAPVATRVEGLQAACAALVRSGDVATHSVVVRAVARAVDYLSRQQYTPEQMSKFGYTERARGGFPMHAADPVIRNDVVQHAISALLHECL